MTAALTFLRDIDLGDQLRRLWELEHIDSCFGGLVVGLFVCLGHKMASGNRSLYVLGLRLGALALLLRGGWAVYHFGGWQNLPWASQISRTGLIAGTVVALTWVLLPIAVFVYRYYRVAIAAFVVAGGYGLATAEEFTQDSLLNIGLRGLLVAGLAMILAWITQPVWDVVIPKRRVTPAAPPVPAAPAAPPAQPAEAKKEESGPDAEAERLARLERKRWKKLVLMFTKPATNFLSGPGSGSLFPSSDTRRRRDKARLTAELSYVMAMPEIAVQFPHDMFKNWVERYLGDHLPAEEVEENSLHLQMIIAQQQKRQQNSGTGMNLEDMHVWYADEMKRIQALDLDLASKQAKLLHLQEMFLSMTQRFVGDAAPSVVPLLPRPTIGLLIDKDDPNMLPKAKAE